MKKALLLIFAVGIIGGAVAVTATAASNYLSKPAVTSDACQGKSGETHILTIKDDAASTGHIQATYCDILTVINRDDRLRTMAFGVHDHHRAYSGITEKVLAKDQSFTVTLDEIGNFLVHDHQQESVGSSFTVTN